MLRILLFVVTLSLASTAPAAELRIGMSAEVTSIDPHYINIAPNNAIAWHMFDALTHVDEHARIVPGLAESWRALDDTTWEFKPRKGVRFHDGSEFTAEDVVFSLERPAQLGNSPSPFTAFVRPIVAKQIVDAYTVRLKTATPYALVPYDLNSIYIVSKKAAASAQPADFDSGHAAVGTGPFKFAAFRRGDRVELTRNDSYWGGSPAWDKVAFRILTSDGPRVAALLAGDLDAIENIPTADLKRLAGDARFRLAQTVSWRTIFLCLDQSRDASPFVTDIAGKPLAKNPLKDVRVRRAISAAINRAAIVERIMDGLALPAANVVAPPVFAHVASRKPDAYDPPLARQLLAQAGYPNGFALTLHAPNDRYVNDDQIAQAVAQMLSKVGVPTKVAAMPAAAYFSKAREAAYSFTMLGWGSFAGDLALRALAATFDPASGWGAWNFGRYSNARVDQLLKQSFASVDQKKREQFAQEAAGIALDDAALIPLHHQIVSWAMKRSLRYTPRTDEYTLARQFAPAN